MTDPLQLRTTRQPSAAPDGPRTGYAVYRQQTGVPFRRLYFQQPVLIVVRRGEKTIVLDRSTVSAVAGAVVVASAGHVADVINTPDAGGIYEAEVIAFGTDVLSSASGSSGATMRFGSFRAPAEFEASLAAAREALCAINLPARIVTHRILELLAWANEFGIAPTFGDPQDLPSRLRAIVATDPARDWRIAEIATALAMSEPSLRRHLSAQGTSASQIIADVRMTRALEQLQTSTTSITEIALDAGYDSPSRFAARFRARFGLRPGEIRGRNEKNDRISTAIDRNGLAAG